MIVYEPSIWSQTRQEQGVSSVIMKNESALPESALKDSKSWLEIVRQQVGSLQFGVVQIVVHNSRVTQIDRTERFRLDPPSLQTVDKPPVKVWQD